MNKPIQEIAKLFYNENPNGKFSTECGWYIEHGAFRSDSGIAYLARPADTRTPTSYEGRPEQWGDGEPNAWFVAYAAGDLDGIAAALKSVKPHYPYIIWGRSQWRFGRWKITKTKSFLNKIKLYGKISKSS